MEESQETETQETESQEAESQETESQETVKQLNLDISFEYHGEWEDGESLLTAKCPQIQIMDDGYEVLKQVLEEYNEKNRIKIRQLYEEELARVKENKTKGHYIDQSITLKRADESIISFEEWSDYDVSDADHPMRAVRGINYDPHTGKVLALQDVVCDYDGLYRYTPEVLKEDYDSLAWTMDREGLTLYFNRDELAPNASEMQTVTISWKDHPELFQEAYRIQDGGVARKLVSGQTTLADVDEDGQDEEVSLRVIPNEEAYGFDMTISCGDQKLEQFIYGSFKDAYLMLPESGNAYFYLESVGDNDYRSLYIFSLKDGNPVFLDTYPAVILDHLISDPSDFLLYTRLDVLGSYYGYQQYAMGTDGMPKTDEAVYRVFEGPVLTSILEIPAYSVDENGVSSSEETMISTGSRLQIYETDAMSFVRVKTEEGVCFQIPIEKNTELWGWKVNGIDENQCFESLHYAG